jgi:tRNA pseudouridine55 synthase
MMQTHDRLFVAYKPENVSSNRFLGEIKRRYGVKKAGFSGTLDPFAKGVLIIAFGKYTKLFRFLKKAPKTYRATLWLGAESETLDIEKVDRVVKIPPFASEKIEQTLDSLKGELRYLPPKYSAKKINGRRAYELAREGAQEIAMKMVTTTVYDIKVLHYMHPFLTFEVTVSEGGYVRSIGEIIADRLGTGGALSMLERTREGVFRYEEERALDPLLYLDLKENRYLGKLEDIELGRKLRLDDFQKRDEGLYVVKCATMFAIVEIKDGLVNYLLNGVNYADTIT